MERSNCRKSRDNDFVDPRSRTCRPPEVEQHEHELFDKEILDVMFGTRNQVVVQLETA